MVAPERYFKRFPSLSVTKLTLEASCEFHRPTDMKDSASTERRSFWPTNLKRRKREECKCVPDSSKCTRLTTTECDDDPAPLGTFRRTIPPSRLIVDHGCLQGRAAHSGLRI